MVCKVYPSHRQTATPGYQLAAGYSPPDGVDGPKSAEKPVLGVSQLAWRETVMVRQSFLTGCG
jgi:hypothetical protein